MNVIHQDLAQGRWQAMPLIEQMAHIGSEVHRALNWRKKNKNAMCQKAVYRALDLLQLSLQSQQRSTSYKEIARVREAVVDYFLGDNIYGSSEKSWRKYFDHFNHAVAIKKNSL